MCHSVTVPRAGSCGSAACTCAHLYLSIPGAAAGAQLQAQAAKLFAWHSTGSLAEPGIEVQSAIFQALAFSRRPIPPLHSLMSWQPAASCVQASCFCSAVWPPYSRCLKFHFPHAYVNFSKVLLAFHQCSGEEGGLLTVCFHNKSLSRAAKNFLCRT